MQKNINPSGTIFFSVFTSTPRNFFPSGCAAGTAPAAAAAAGCAPQETPPPPPPLAPLLRLKSPHPNPNPTTASREVGPLLEARRSGDWSDTGAAGEEGRETRADRARGSGRRSPARGGRPPGLAWRSASDSMGGAAALRAPRDARWGEAEGGKGGGGGVGRG
ncbi:Os01g0647150, partial [Oryza sativa Japonica Group]